MCIPVICCVKNDEVSVNFLLKFVAHTHVNIIYTRFKVFKSDLDPLASQLVALSS